MSYNDQIKMSIALRAAAVLHDLAKSKERKSCIEQEDLIGKIHHQFGRRYMPREMISQFVKDNFVSLDTQKEIIKGDTVEQVPALMIVLPS